MKARILALILSLALFSAISAPAVTGTAVAAPAATTHTTAPAHFFDKTRFLLHAGIAFYAFHHWVIRVYQQGGFKSGSPHRVGNIVKAGIATIFAYHELQVAYGIAKKSNSATLHAIIAPLQKLESVSGAVGNHLKNGNYNPSDISSLTGNVNGLGSAAAKAGLGIKDVPFNIPGL